MIAKQITFFGKQCILACDANCGKAWGISNRPKLQLSNDEDDIVWLADGELGEAPQFPGTWEGGQGKPLNPEGRLNKWCARECERSVIVDVGEDFSLKDFSKRRYNQPFKHKGEES
jgi:hypothetical protein